MDGYQQVVRSTQQRVTHEVESQLRITVAEVEDYDDCGSTPPPKRITPMVGADFSHIIRLLAKQAPPLGVVTARQPASSPPQKCVLR